MHGVSPTQPRGLRLPCLLILTILLLAGPWRAGPAAAGELPAASLPRLRLYTGLGKPVQQLLEARLKEACRRAGCQVVLIALPSRRALFLANQEGDGDACRVAQIKALAPASSRNLVQIPESIVTLDLTVFTKGLRFQVHGWESLSRYRNGARSGARILEANLPGTRTLLPDNRQLFKMLAASRLDTVVEWRLLGLHAIQELHLTDIIPLTPPLQRVRFYSYLHRRHQRLVAPLAAALRAMKQDGSFQRLRTAILAETTAPVPAQGKSR